MRVLGKSRGYYKLLDYNALENILIEKEIKSKLICSNCNKNGTETKTEIHHKDGNIDNNKIENLCRLCIKCHKVLHAYIRYLAGRKNKSYNYYKTITNKKLNYDFNRKLPLYVFTNSNKINLLKKLKPLVKQYVFGIQQYLFTLEKEAEND